MGEIYDANHLYDQNGTYDDGLPAPIVPPSAISPTRCAFQAAIPDQFAERLLFGAGLARENALRARCESAAADIAPFRGEWSGITEQDHAVHLRVDAARGRENATRIEWASVAPRSAETRIALDAAAAKLSSMLSARWSSAIPKQAAIAAVWSAALAKIAATRLPWAAAAAKNAFVRIRWGAGYPYQSGYTVPFPGEPDPPPGSTIIIPPSEVYFMIPALTIIRDSDGADLRAIDASVKLDLASYAWTLDATIPRQTLDLVDPNTNSEPVLVDVTINGYLWKMIVESYSDNRRFGATGCKIRGRSASALLGIPYAPLATFTSTANKDASQLAGDLMPTGWSLTWSTQDWLVPAGLFSYAELAPIDALAQLVNAIGGTIYPDQSAQSLTINPLYPTSPWNWPSATPYADVPASFIAELSGQWQGNFKTDYNGIYVSGQNAGIVGLVKRTGTAGDVLLPTVTDALLCVTAANVERGRIELSKAHARKSETIRVPLLPPGGSGNPGVFQPGQLLQITEPAAWAPAAWLGQIMAVQIDAVHSAAPGSALSVRQTLTIERHA